MGADRKVGIGILATMAAVGLVLLAGLIFGGMAAFSTFLCIFGSLILYIGLIAAIHDEDPFVWTFDKIGELIDKRKGKSNGEGNPTV